MQKLYQITDTVHETIYLSDFEKDIMATPYFNRLHDVYQNSAVYLTYPCNRTKRYEHSIPLLEVPNVNFRGILQEAFEYVLENNDYCQEYLLQKIKIRINIDDFYLYNRREEKLLYQDLSDIANMINKRYMVLPRLYAYVNLTCDSSKYVDVLHDIRMEIGEYISEKLKDAINSIFTG